MKNLNFSVDQRILESNVRSSIQQQTMIQSPNLNLTKQLWWKLKKAEQEQMTAKINKLKCSKDNWAKIPPQPYKTESD